MLIKNFTEQEPQHTPCVCRLLGKELSRSDCIVLEFLKGAKLGNRPARPSGVHEINEINEFPFKCLFPKVTRSVLFSSIVAFKASKNRTSEGLPL